MKAPAHALGALLAATSLLGAGCETQHKSSTVASDAGATATKFVTADPKLEKALQAAASATPDDKGPPPDGVFGPGLADRRHPKGAPTKVDVVTDGDEPRVMIVAAGAPARASSYGPAGLELAAQMGARIALPTVDLSLVLAPGKKDEGGSDWIVADLKKVVPAREQFGELPAGTDKEVARLVGTELRIKTGADGLSSDLAIALPKGAPDELGRVARNGAEALTLATLAPPPRAVGVGAQWIAETRMTLAGVDVVAYRAYRVKSVTGDRLRGSVDLRAYATSSDPQLEGVPKGATLVQMNAEGQGEMEIVKGELMARKADIQERVVMVFQPADPGKRHRDHQGVTGPAGLLLHLRLVRRSAVRTG